MVIDTKCRPPFGALTESYVFNLETRQRCARRFQMELPQSFLQSSMEQFINEMDANGVQKALVPVRRFSGTCGDPTEAVSNDVLFQLTAAYPGRFLGVPDIDSLGGQNSIEVIKQYTQYPEICGIALEPGYQFIDVDDSRIYPIYNYCQTNQIPIFLSFGGKCQRKLSNLQPVALDRILTDFPDLTIITAHGGWPYVQEMMWNGLLHKNLYLMPDIYMLNIPGSRDFIDAANTLLTEQIVFGSAYPCVSYAYVLKYLQQHLSNDVLPKVLYANALKAIQFNFTNL